MRQSMLRDALQAFLVMWLNRRAREAGPDDVVREVGGMPLCDSHRVEALKRAAARLGYDTPAEMLADLAHEVVAAEAVQEVQELSETLRDLAGKIGKDPLSSDLLHASEQLEEVAQDLQEALDADDDTERPERTKSGPQRVQPAPGA